MMKGKREDARGPENSIGLAPTFCEEPLVEAVRIFGLTRTVGDNFESLRHILGIEVVSIAILQHKSQPHIEEIRQFGVMKETTKWRIGHDKIERLACQDGEVRR